MFAPNRPTSTLRLLSTRTTRIALLLDLIAVAASVLSATSSLGQRLFARATAIVIGGHVALVNHTLTAEPEEEAAPTASATMTVERHDHTTTRLTDGRVRITLRHCSPMAAS